LSGVRLRRKRIVPPAGGKVRAAMLWQHARRGCPSVDLLRRIAPLRWPMALINP
jgi:hypothetical protein